MRLEQIADADVQFPRQKLVKPMGRMINDADNDVDELSLRINTIHFGRLCRPPPYAERFWRDSLVCEYSRPFG
ncbi:hypothetical protein [Bradyrhizobium sp. 23AC]